MVLVIDPQVAGVSGDMFLCSLVSLGADRDRIAGAIRACEGRLPGSKITRLEFGRVQRRGIDAVEMILEAEEAGERKGTDMKQAVRDSVRDLSLSKEAQAFAASCIDRLISSESRVHGMPEESVHFHEAAGFDTLADIVGSAVALDCLGLFAERIVCLPVSVGGDTVTFSHGTMSNPAGAILEILRGAGLAIRGSGARVELATPTGACILASLNPEPVEFYPLMKIDTVGYGAGQRDIEGFANVLKVVRGPDPLGTDSVKVLETNVDDVSGEILGSLVEKIMALGAKDVSIYHGITKKNRPTNLVSVMCGADAVEKIVDALVLETGTLGVRISDSARFVVPRTEHRVTIPVGGRPFEVRYKKSEFKGTVAFKIEFEDVARVSRETKRPIKETESLLRRGIEEDGRHA